LPRATSPRASSSAKARTGFPGTCSASPSGRRRLDLQINAAAVRGDKDSIPSDVASVIEPEIGRDAGKNHEVGPAKRFLAPVPHLQAVRSAEETAAHP